MSEPYYDDEFYEDDDGFYADDENEPAVPDELREAIAPIIQETVAQELAPLIEGYGGESDVDWDEQEARWHEEDAALDAEAREQEANAAAEQEAVLRVSAAAEAAGITDPRVAVEAYEFSNGLIEDPDFQRRHPDPAELVEAAIAEGVRLAARRDGDDELEAATSYMARKHARERHARQRAGVLDTSAEERRADAWAEVGGLTKQERAEFRRALGLPQESR